MASLRNKKIVLSPGQQYDFPINGDSVRLASANVPIYFKTRDGDLDFYLEQGEKASFSGQDFLTLTIYHLDASDQTIIISVGKDADIGSARFSGNVSISAPVDLSASTLAALENITIQNLGASYGASYRSVALLAANTPETIFTPAANVNGAILHSAQFYSQCGSGGANTALLAKTSAPSSVTDGDGILSADSAASQAGAPALTASLQNPIRIPAGKGLYAISAILETVGSRSALYTLL